MIISSDFEGDSNDVLKDIQHDLWFHALAEIDGKVSSSCQYIFFVARSELVKNINACPLLFEYDLEDINEINNLDSIDHRILQYFHDQIASYYRWLIKDEVSPRFFNDKVLYKKYLINNWIGYLIIEINSLIFSNLDIAENIVDSVYFANEKKGYESEALLNNTLISLYHDDYFEAVNRYRLKRN